MTKNKKTVQTLKPETKAPNFSIGTGAAQAIKELQDMQFKPTQSRAFIESRPAGVQYFIDVLALAFVLSIVLIAFSKVGQ